jgi:hypothetical protein
MLDVFDTIPPDAHALLVLVAVGMLLFGAGLLAMRKR